MTQSPLATKLRVTIKGLMKKRGVTYDDLATALQVSHSTVKRILNLEDLSLNRVEQIAKFFDMDAFELMSLCQEINVVGEELTEEQELFLAQNSDVAHYFWMLLNGMSSDDITQRCGFTTAQTEKHLSTLADLGFLKRSGRDKIKLNYQWPIGFRFDGPLHKTFTEKIFELFLDHLIDKVKMFKGQRPESPGFSIRLVQFILTTTSYQELLKESAELIAKYTNESRIQLAINPSKELETVSFMVGIDKFDAIAKAFGRRPNDID